MVKKYCYLLLLFLVLELGLIPNPVFSKEEGIRVYMEDGQIYTRDVRVCVPDRKITLEMNPRLSLGTTKRKRKKIAPIEIATNQQWKEIGKEGIQTGTLLLFNLAESGYSMSIFKACERVLPILRWQESETSSQDKEISGKEMIAVSARYIVLGNEIGAFILTLIMVLIFLFIIKLFFNQYKDKLSDLIVILGGKVSLSLFQMALWTVVLGFMVMWFGLMRLKVPHIPDTLVLLMGLSAGTSAVGHFQEHRLRKQIDKGLVIKSKTKINKKLSSMLMISINGEEDPSLAKAQLLFWTFITIILFVVKSYLEGELWDIPYQLVFLMGISQGTFLARKQMAIYETKKEDGEQPQEQQEITMKKNDKSDDK